jgi:hypothetical protein
MYRLLGIVILTALSTGCVTWVARDNFNGQRGGTLKYPKFKASTAYDEAREFCGGPLEDVFTREDYEHQEYLKFTCARGGH